MSLGRNLLNAKTAARWLLASALIVGSAAIAGERITSIWMIEPAAPWDDERPIGKGDLLVRPDVLPRGLVRLEADVSGQGDGVLLRKGELLYRLDVASGAAFCTVERQRKTGAELITVGSLGVLICIVDHESDGTYDGYYRKIATDGVPIIFGSVPSRLKPLGPVITAELPPATLSGRYGIHVSLANDPAKAKILRFGYFIGNDDEQGVALAGVTRVRTESLPQQFTVLGGQFELTRIDDGKAMVRMVKSTERQPFEMQSTYIKF